ncbi:MAG: nucleotidyl transferase AbiEii/AbiGii toxin family protein [Gammaproteobacteria bacterium]|nr:nucleotidyl transferase AbiEii/AbiGii toxin family protein [Gammaproteobacteria bacterium]MDE0258003.1 nucleotidyl transferase AbiEii/AbiGii toxin family protein [Gammaproteobacteria bacterium]
MAEVRYAMLSATEKRDALEVAEQRGGHRTYLLEKDTWVVATLRVLFEAPFGRHLVFKGGTSLSKVWRAIRRFSEDIDITYDIRGFAPDLVAGGDEEALPPTRSQERRWTRAIRPRLAEWVRDTAHPLVERELDEAGFAASVRAEAEQLYVAYDPLFKPIGPVRPEVRVDFGARSTGEPHTVQSVVCDAAAVLPDLGFPMARAAVMLAERTFWEKATSMHVYCLQGRVRGQRWSRHWHDLARLGDAGIAARALTDRELALSVARHKAMFFRENDSNRRRIDYEAAVSGNLRLVPSGAAQESLAEDYTSMLAAGMLVDEDDPFETLMQRCALIEEMANARWPSQPPAPND